MFWHTSGIVHIIPCLFWNCVNPTYTFCNIEACANIDKRRNGGRGVVLYSSSHFTYPFGGFGNGGCHKVSVVIRLQLGHEECMSTTYPTLLHITPFYNMPPPSNPWPTSISLWGPNAGWQLEPSAQSHHASIGWNEKGKKALFPFSVLFYVIWVMHSPWFQNSGSVKGRGKNQKHI